MWIFSPKQICHKKNSKENLPTKFFPNQKCHLIKSNIFWKSPASRLSIAFCPSEDGSENGRQIWSAGDPSFTSKCQTSASYPPAHCGVWPPPGDGFHQGPLTPNPTRKASDGLWMGEDRGVFLLYSQAGQEALVVTSHHRFLFPEPKKNPSPCKSISYL